MQITIADRRRILKLTQQQMGEKTGISRNRISDLETGRFPPRPHEVDEIAKVLQCSPQDLLIRPGPPNRSNNPAALEKVKKFRHKPTYRPPRDRTGESRLATARNCYSETIRELEPWLTDPPVRQFIADAPFDSTLEFVFWMERIRCEKATPTEVAPLYTGFDRYSVVCPKTRRVVGHTPVPALVTDSWLAILQVSMLTPGLYTVDALVCVIEDRTRYHFVLELEGPGKPPPNPRRDRALGLPIIRFTKADIEAGTGIRDKVEQYFEGAR